MPKKTYILNKTDEPASFKIDYAAELNKEQLEVVQNGDGPCLVLAGAGSGKTRTLVYRVAYLLEKGVPSDRILLVTFTNKAAREMLDRVEQLVGRPPKGLCGGTFHSVANLILRKNAKVLGYTSSFGILDSDDQKKLIAQVFKDLNIPKESYIPKKKVIHSIISFAKNSQKSIREVVEQKYAYLLPEVIPIIERISDAYEAKKKASNVMDFDDLLSNWLVLLQQYPNVSAKLCEKFEYVLVDEFQDTNVVQAKLVHHLAEPQRNLLVVGDDAQSIYSFRAAIVENILSFQKIYPEASIHKLEVNYRSTPEILKLANASIRNNQFQYEKNLRSLVDQSKSRSAKNTRPVLIPARDSQQQAEVICQRVLELRDEGKTLDDMAVLFRSSYQIIELELELNRRGIPYVVRGGLRFFEQAHIKDVLAYISLLHNPRDEISWRRVLGLYEGVGPATATKAWKKMKTTGTLSEMLSKLTETNVRGKAFTSFGRIQRVFFKLLEIKEDKIGEMIHAVLEAGYQFVLEKTYDDARDRLEDLHQLAIFSGNYKTLAEFLSEASLSEGFRGERAAAQKDEHEEKLVLTTIHQAKGLEWDVVFAMGLAEGQFPHYKTLEKPKEMEEERRLFYVTVTRPRQLLYLLYPIMSRSYATGDKINRPSLFIREVDEDLFETWNVAEESFSPVVSLKSTSDDSTEYVDEWSDNDDAGSILDIIRGI